MLLKHFDSFIFCQPAVDLLVSLRSSSSCGTQFSQASATGQTGASLEAEQLDEMVDSAATPQHHPSTTVLQS